MTLQDYIDHFRARVLQDALAEATAGYWNRRADAFARVGNQRCDAIAQACRNRAQFLADNPLIAPGETVAAIEQCA